MSEQSTIKLDTKQSGKKESDNVESHMCKKMSRMRVCHAQPHAVNKGATDDVNTDMFPDVPSHKHCIYNGSGTEWRENMMAYPLCQYQMK